MIVRSHYRIVNGKRMKVREHKRYKKRPVNSSFIDSLDSDTKSKKFDVVINGEVFPYQADKITQRKFLRASSKGRFYNKHIRSNSKHFPT